MVIQRIKAQNFRSYEQLELKFCSKFNAFLGLNGMGKTNALDAIYYLCLGKSYFSSGDRHVLKKGEEFIRNEGWFLKQDKEYNVVSKVRPGKKKDMEVNQKKLQRLSDHIGAFPCVMIAPADIQLLIEGSTERRTLMDQCISQYDHRYLADLILYNKLLKQRNALLKASKEIRYLDERLLETYSKQMHEPALKIYAKRKEFCVEMSSLFKSYYAKISNNAEDCSVEYKSGLALKTLDELFKESNQKDQILGRTTEGIHKDDLIFKLKEERIKPFASQGQLKSFIVALKLAEYEIIKKSKGFNPILLLDDLFDKLDHERTAHLLDLLNSDAFGQVFISDTDLIRIPKILNELKALSVVNIVDNGKIVSHANEEE